jgi:hypothetical protein
MILSVGLLLLSVAGLGGYHVQQAWWSNMAPHPFEDNPVCGNPKNLNVGTYLFIDSCGKPRLDLKTAC